MDQHLITRIVEAALLAANQPLTLAQLNGLFPEDQPAPDGSVGQAIQALQADCAERGVELVELASGWRYQVKGEVHPWVARMWTERKTKYTRATLETLALIAYRQPITRGEIEQIRGVAVSSNIIQSLEEREWIRVVGHRDVPGKPALFGTTKVFLDYFGLKRLDELPPLSELKDIGELEPQLQFDGAPLGVGGIATDAQAEAANNAEAGDGGDESQAAAAGAAAKDAGGTGAIDSDEITADTARALDEGAREDVDSVANAADRNEFGSDNFAAPHATVAGTTDDTHDHPVDDIEADLESYDDDDLGSDDAYAETGYAIDRNDAPTGNPEAAPGKRAADENDREQDNAVETTTVPELVATSNEDGPEQLK